MTIEQIKTAAILYILGMFVYGFWKGFLPHADGRTLKDYCEEVAQELETSDGFMYLLGCILLILISALWPFWLIEGTILNIKDKKEES